MSIYDAVRDGDIGFFRSMYAEDPKTTLGEEVYDGVSLLDLASQLGSDDLVLYLVDIGCRIDSHMWDDDIIPYYVLGELARRGRYELLREVIRRTGLTIDRYIDDVDTYNGRFDITFRYFVEQQQVVDEGWREG